MTVVKLRDVAREIRTKADESDGSLPAVGLEHLDSEEIELTRWDSDSCGTFTKKFRAGQMLFGRRRAYLRKAAIAPIDGVCSGDIIVIEAIADKLSPGLLPFVIQSDALFAYAVEKSAGSLSPRVKWEKLAEFEFELPSMNIQEKLATLLWSVQKTKMHYRGLLAIADDLVKSQFVEMFGDPQSFDKNGMVVSEVANIRVGIVIKPTRYYDDSNKGKKAFRSLNVGPMYIRDEDWVYFGEQAMTDARRTVANEGDVLIVRSGYPGTSCVVTEEYSGCNVIDLLIASPDTTRVLPEYFCAFMNYPHGKAQIDRMQHGVAQKHFNVGMCKDMKMIVPPMKQQKAFVFFLQQVDKSKFELQKALDDLNAMTKKIVNQELGLGNV